MSIETVIRRMRRTYNTVRYGEVVSYAGELYEDGFIYHGVDNDGDAGWLSRTAHIQRIPLDAIPPAPFAPGRLSGAESRLLHFLEWGRRQYLADASHETVMRECDYSIPLAIRMARGAMPDRIHKSIWYDTVVEHLNLTPEHIKP